MTVVGSGGQITTLGGTEEKSTPFTDDQLQLILDIVSKKYARTKNVPPDVSDLMLVLKVKLNRVSNEDMMEYKGDPLS